MRLVYCARARRACARVHVCTVVVNLLALLHGCATGKTLTGLSLWDSGPRRPQMRRSGSGMHGLHLNSRAGTIWKERMAGGEELMLDMLPRRLHGIAEQLLGKGQVLPADGSSVGQMLGVPDDENFVKVLEERGKSDIGADAMCARWLHKLATEDWPVKKPPEANLYDMFVVGTRSRGIYATLPSPPDAQRQKPGPGRGGHNDSHPFQLGVEAYIDDVPPNGECWSRITKLWWGALGKAAFLNG